AGGCEGRVTAAVDVGQADDLVAGPDDLLHGERCRHRGGGEAVDVARRGAGDEQLRLGAGDDFRDATAGGGVGLPGRRGDDVGDDRAARGPFVDRAGVGETRGARGHGSVHGGGRGRPRRDGRGGARHGRAAGGGGRGGRRGRAGRRPD